MKTIFFPGNSRQVCTASYGVVIDKEGVLPVAHIVFYQDARNSPSTSLLNTNEGRDTALNMVLSNELKGIRTEFMRLTVISGSDGGHLHAFAFPMHLDIEDYVAKGNICDIKQAPADNLSGVLLNLIGKGDKSYSFWSYNVVGGCANFYTSDDDMQKVSHETAKELLENITPFELR